MQQQEILKTLSDRFNSLSMPNPSMRVAAGAQIPLNHPHEFLICKFPTFNDFYDYFAELAPHYHGAGTFAEMLNNIYEDMRNIPILISGMDKGNAPAKIDAIYKSMQLFNFLAQKKFTLSNAKLAQEYTDKYRSNKK